jgi:hypothetical protein
MPLDLQESSPRARQAAVSISIRRHTSFVRRPFVAKPFDNTCGCVRIAKRRGDWTTYLTRFRVL